MWSAADKLRANSELKSSEYATPVQGQIFLKFADNNYIRYEAEILEEYKKLKGTRREKNLSDIAIEKCGFYDRVLFRGKCDNVLYLMLDYASHGRKWAA